MRYAVAIAAVVALAAIAGSAGSVIMKDYPARLAVSVDGVPGYVYYNQAYDVTIEYANLGGGVSGPVELSAVLPETFALADRIGDPASHGERLVWTLDGLDAGERGSVTFALQGTLPAELTNAVYDLPGYAGHTAFVEGFELAATLTAGSQTASTLAVADTGLVLLGSLLIVKQCDEGDLTTGFVINVSGDGVSEDVMRDCPDPDGPIILITPISVPTNVELTVSETPPEGYEEPTFGGDCAPDGTVTISSAEPEGTCTVRNTLSADENGDGDDNGDGTDGGGTGDDGVECPACDCCGFDLDIDIDNDNTNVIGIDNDNTNDNANDNANENANDNENENENDNENTNEQTQTNDQDQDNENDQTNNITSGPEVNISGVAPHKPADPKPVAGGSIKPPSTGDAGLATSGGGLAPVVVVLLLGSAVLGAAAIRPVRREG